MEPTPPHPSLNETILALYQHSTNCPIPDFKPWVMETVGKVIGFDSGIWITTDIVSDAHNSVYLHKQTPAMLANYFQTLRISGDALAAAVIASPGRTIDADHVIPRHEFIHHPAYLLHCKHFGMEHTLCTGHIAPVTNIKTAISFYRADPDTCFSEGDRLAKELLVPHMTEALRINLFSALRQGTQAGAAGALAVCDAVGNLYETTHRFAALLQAAWPDWRGPQLQLPVETLADAVPLRWSRDGISFEASPCNDLYLLAAARCSPIDTLTPRQREVAQALTRGMRYKDIAREMDISPATVTKYVNQINARLGISKREQLVRLFDSDAG